MRNGFAREIAVRRVAFSVMRLALIGASLVLCGQLTSLSAHGLDEFLSGNHMEIPLRNLMLVTLAAGTGTPVLFGLGYLAVLRARGIPHLERVARLASPLMLAAVVPILWNERLGQPFALQFLVLLSGSALLLERLVQNAADAIPSGWMERGSRWLDRWGPVTQCYVPLAVVVLGAVLYAGYTAHFTLMTHRRMATSAFDLGIYDNLLFNALHGRFFRSPVCMGAGDGNYLSNHAEFAMLLFVPFYAMKPGAESLLVFQSLILGAGAIPLYLFAASRIPRSAAVIVALGYLLYAPMHGAQFYDFHWLPTATFFFFLLFFALSTHRTKLAAASVAMLLLIREDLSAGLCVFGVFLVAIRHKPRFGAYLSLVSAAWFVVVKFIVMPWAGPWWFSNIYGELIANGEQGYGSIVKTILINPGFFIATLLKEQKLVYLLHILAPLVFLPWRRAPFLLLAIPGFFFTIMTTGYDPTLRISFQYTTHWIAYMFGASILALCYLHKQKGGAALAGGIAALAFALLAHSYVFGAVLQRRSFVGGFSHIAFEITSSEIDRLAVLRSLVAQIPRDASVIATETEVPHLSARKFAYTLRNESVATDYVVIFRERMGESERKHMEEILDKAKSQYQLVEGNMGVYLFRKGAVDETTRHAWGELGVTIPALVGGGA